MSNLKQKRSTNSDPNFNNSALGQDPLNVSSPINSSKSTNSVPFELSFDNIDFSILEFGSSPLYDSTNSMLKISKHNDPDENSKIIMKFTPEISPGVYSLSGDSFAKAVGLYKFKVLCFHLGYLKDYLPVFKEHLSTFGIIKGSNECFTELSGVGFEPQIILSSTSKLISKFQTKFQTFVGLDLTLVEIDELEAVRERRRILNVKYTSFLSSDKYSHLSEKEKMDVLNQRDNDLDTATSTLFRICTLGPQYLSSSARLNLKLKPGTKLDDLLQALRKSEIQKFRSLKENYKFPKSVS